MPATLGLTCIAALFANGLLESTRSGGQTLPRDSLPAVPQFRFLVWVASAQTCSIAGRECVFF